MLGEAVLDAVEVLPHSSGEGLIALSLGFDVDEQELLFSAEELDLDEVVGVALTGVAVRGELLKFFVEELRRDVPVDGLVEVRDEELGHGLEVALDGDFEGFIEPDFGWGGLVGRV